MSEKSGARPQRAREAFVDRVVRLPLLAAALAVFPDEGHWVLKPLNSKCWHEAVFGWMKKWLER